MGLIRNTVLGFMALFLVFFFGIAAIDTITRIVSAHYYGKVKVGMREDDVIKVLGTPRHMLTAESRIGRPISPLLSQLREDDRMFVYGYSRVKACITLNDDGFVTSIQTVADE